MAIKKTHSIEPVGNISFDTVFVSNCVIRFKTKDFDPQKIIEVAITRNIGNKQEDGSPFTLPNSEVTHTKTISQSEVLSDPTMAALFLEFEQAYTHLLNYFEGENTYIQES